MSKLTSIPGVGPATAQKLESGGVQSVDEVADAAVELLAALTGFYGARAATIRDAARDLAGHSLAEDPAPLTVVPPQKTGGKNKKEKKARKLEAIASKLKKAAKKAKKAGKKKKAKKAKKAWKKAARVAKKARAAKK